MVTELQLELLDRRSWTTRAELASAIFEWIEGWYNPRRRHTSIGDLPAGVEHYGDGQAPSGCSFWQRAQEGHVFYATAGQVEDYRGAREGRTWCSSGGAHGFDARLRAWRSPAAAAALGPLEPLTARC